MLGDPMRAWQRRAGVIVMAGALLAGCTETGSPTTSRTLLATTTTSTAPSEPGSPGSAGSDGLGDRLYPQGGNGGYDVSHYNVEIGVSDPGGPISVVTTIEATATQSLSSFNLDLHGMEVGSVTVDEIAATTDRAGDELTVTPPTAIADDATFTTVVTYSGIPDRIPDEVLGGALLGWWNADGNTFVVSEPTGAKSFLASNDHPSDKATFTFRITAPADDTAIANGTLISSETVGGSRVWIYEMAEPMATYLAQVAIGSYDLIDGGTIATGTSTVVVRSAVVSTLPANARGALDKIPEIIEFYQRRFGPYPFTSAGVLIADSPPEFALETQALPILPTLWFTGGGMTPSETVTIMAHEFSHQWFGNSVALAEWSDMWLNEGFATWAEWWWGEHHGQASVADKINEAIGAAAGFRADFGAVLSPADGELFSPNQYDGAALVVEALRRTVGDETFNRILRTWLARFAGQSVRSADFEALAAEVSGQDLGDFFDGWLRSTTVPKMPAPIGDGSVT